ncbi:Integral membrane protein superfamily [Haloferax mucosum ATCC BAA-1512]|uniref:Integral membrane protein superfamily n=1 Tax=Haloferax mucosum ATCC BAA-1512 TaxID=662479 RepID=M0IBT9_9EURY|nr:VIT1/CCC1 transporter family protein [Haloferax mucosum]ELZ94265.1 Integral membrane protein superfamily [Haloferax mucosum ATCC BAA-1512]
MTPRQLAELVGNEQVRAISRRYFVSNGFDGALTCIGLVIGAFLTGITDGMTVVEIGVGAAVGLTTSGVWSVWEIERAEKRAELARIEDAMLADLDGTAVERQKVAARGINAAASGLGPLVGIVIPLLPFLAVGPGLSMTTATLTSVFLGTAILFSFGAYMGSISNQRWYVAGVRMALAGVAVAIVNLLFGG